MCRHGQETATSYPFDDYSTVHDKSNQYYCHVSLPGVQGQLNSSLPLYKYSTHHMMPHVISAHYGS